MLKKILIGSLVSLGTVVAAMPAHAISFIASYNDTVSLSSVSGVNAGDPLSILIELDNGGTSIANQTWTSANVTNIIFDFNNGANRTVFNPVFNSSFGNFVTDGSGILTEVPTDWLTFPGASVQSTNSTSTPDGWYINGQNGVFFTTDGGGVDISNVAGNTVSTNWTIAPAPTAVPFDFDPSLGIALLGVGFFVRKTLKKKITKV
jgi:hypothetical protein